MEKLNVLNSVRLTATLVALILLLFRIFHNEITPSVSNSSSKLFSNRKLVISGVQETLSWNRQLQDPKVPEEVMPEMILNEDQVLLGLRILYVVAMYDYKQYIHTEAMIDSCRDLCEAGSNVTLVLQTTVVIPDEMVDIFRQRQYCAHPHGSFEILIDKYPPSVKLDLAQKHRQYMYQRLEEYDLFIYSEDDMHIRPMHVATYLSETKVLKDAIPDMFSHDYAEQRYALSIIRWESAFDIEDVASSNQNVAKKINDLGNSSRVYWENFLEDYDVVDVKPGLGPYLTMRLPHTAMWMLTKEQMAWLRFSCNFQKTRPDSRFNRFKRSKEQGPITFRSGHKTHTETFTVRVWVSSLQFNKCGLKRIIPLHLLESLGVHHLPDKNWKRKLGNNKPAVHSKIIGNQQFDEMVQNVMVRKGIKHRTMLNSTQHDESDTL